MKFAIKYFLRKVLIRNKTTTLEVNGNIKNDMLQLFSWSEIENSSKRLKGMGLKGHHDKAKNWDLYLSVSNCQGMDKFSNILDAGSGSKAVFAKSMADLGFRNVFACDFQDIRVPQIKSSKCDIVQTPYADNFFSAIACLSVVEHGVDLEKFEKEMFRICKAGGELMISTDFWPQEEDHSDKFPYGNNMPPMKIFNNKSLEEFTIILRSAGWELSEFLPLSTPNTRPIHWERMHARFTFVWFKVRKTS
jgi:SAM-dependent methyltransferase